MEEVGLKQEEILNEEVLQTKADKFKDSRNSRVKGPRKPGQRKCRTLRERIKNFWVVKKLKYYPAN